MSSELACLRLAVLLYLAATVAALLAIAVRRETPRALMPRLLGVGLVVHAAALGLRSAHAGHPAVTTFDEALSFLALLLVAIFLVVQFRRPLVALGAVVSPLASVSPSPRTPSTRARSRCRRSSTASGSPSTSGSPSSATRSLRSPSARACSTWCKSVG